MSNLHEGIDKVHEELMEEEELSLKDLPQTIIKQIRGWELLFNRLKKNPEDSKLANSVQRKSIEIAEKIQDFVDNPPVDPKKDDEPPVDPKKDDEPPVDPKKDDEPPVDPKKDDEPPVDPKKDDEPPVDPKKDDEPPVDPKKDDEPPVDPKKDDEPPVDPKKPKGFGTLIMEKKILEIIKSNGDGRINGSALESIIGVDPEDSNDYPEISVHKIRLRKVFMSSDYRLV